MYERVVNQRKLRRITRSLSSLKEISLLFAFSPASMPPPSLLPLYCFSVCPLLFLHGNVKADTEALTRMPLGLLVHAKYISKIGRTKRLQRSRPEKALGNIYNNALIHISVANNIVHDIILVNR